MRIPAQQPEARGIYAWPTRRPWRVVLIVAMVVCASVLLLLGLRIDSSLESMLPEHDSSSAALGKIAHSFDLTNNVTVLVQSTDDRADHAAQLTDFAKRFELAFESARPEGDPPCRVRWSWPDDAERWSREVILPNLLLYLREPEREALAHRLTPAGMAEQFRKNERLAAAPGLAGGAVSSLTRDPLGLHDLVAATYAGLSDAGGGRPGTPMLSPDGRSLLIQVTPVEPTHDSAQINAIVDAVDRAIDQAGPAGLRVSVGGGLAIASAAERSIREDMVVSSIGTVVLLQLIFLLTFRRLLIFPIAFLPAAVGIVAGFGCFALLGRTLSPPTAVLGALLAGLGIDYAIHYLAHTGEREGLAQTSRTLSRPLTLACMTSVIAFLTLIASDVAALRDFATIGAIGLVFTLAATLVLLPATLALLSRHRPVPPRPIATPRWRGDLLILTAVKHRRLGITLSAAAALSSGLVLVIHPDGPVRFDSELSNMHPKPNAPLQTQQDIADAFPGRGETLLLYITAPNEQALIDRASRCTQLLRSDPQARAIVTSTLGIDALIPTTDEKSERRAFAMSLDVARAQVDFDQALSDSLFNPDAFTGYRDALAGLLRPGEGPTLAQLREYPDLTPGLLPHNSKTDHRSPALWSAVSLVSTRDMPQTREARAAVIDAVRHALADVPGVTLTGLTVVGHDVETQVRHELPRLMLLAGVVVIAWLALCYRSVRDVVLALLPVALGLLVTFAAIRLAGVGLNLLNLVALPLLVGLGVDDGVFMVSIARDCRRRSVGRPALIRALASSAQAVTLTSVTTALAFGSLMLTAVPAIRGLGAVMAVGIGACWVITIVMLAPLIVGRAPQGTADDTSAEPAS